MVYLRRWLSVCALEALIANCWQVHVRSLLSDLDTLELSVMEIVAVVDVFSFGGVQIVFKFSEVLLAKLGGTFGSESLLYCMVEAFLVLVVDGGAGGTRE